MTDDGGWRRQLTATAEAREQLVAQARALGSAVEGTGPRALILAEQRQDVILAMYEAGMGVRDAAAVLEISIDVVQDALTQARRRRELA